MSHTVKNKDKLKKRINRIKGQLDAVVNILDGEEEPYKILQLLSSSRGALLGLMGEIIEGHIMEHVVEADSQKNAAIAGKEVTEILRSFWK